MGTLRDLIEQASDYAEALFDPDDVMTPHIMGELPDGKLVVVALAASGADLDLMRKLIPRKLAADGCRRWVFFSEAWCAAYGAGDPRVEPIEHPERFEVVTFDAFDVPGNRRSIGSRQILRLDASTRLMPLVFERGVTGYAPSATSREARR